MSPPRAAWISLLAVSLVVLVAFMIAYELAGSAATGWPWWVWGLLALALAIFAIATILMIVGYARLPAQIRAHREALERERLAAAPAKAASPDRGPRPPAVCPQTGKKPLTALQYS